MFSSFLCRIFGCRSNPAIYSAKIEEGQGFSNPEPIADISGWSVWKQEQTEIYVIKHNLGLADPDRQLHIVATPMELDTILVVERVESNQFTISTWTAQNSSPKDSAFMFIAVQHP